MAIDFSRPNSTQGPAAGVSGSLSGTTQKNQPASAQLRAEGDSVQLSADARLLQEISGKLGSTPAIDEERVQQLRQAIADGHYTIDSHQLADKIMRFEAEF